MNTNILNRDTICAIATPHGMGAIAVIRISGSEALPIVSQLFMQNGKPFDMGKMIANKAYYGHIVDNGKLLDEVLVTFFRAPHSFTGEDSAEVSVHGSVYVQQKLLQMNDLKNLSGLLYHILLRLKKHHFYYTLIQYFFPY